MNRILMIGNSLQVSRDVGEALCEAKVSVEYASTASDALEKLRLRSFGAVVTCACSSFEENLSLLEEMRHIRPGVKCVILALQSTPEEVIRALRARVFACFTSPFNACHIADIARAAAADAHWRHDILVISGKPGWVSVRVHCRLVTAERLLTFAKEFSAQLPADLREDLIHALREILLNAMEHGAAFNPELVVEVTAIQTRRALLFTVRDPGAGFRRASVAHVATSSPSHDPVMHMKQREEQGLRPGGYGLLLADGTVDELIYNEIGNEVLLIKYADPDKTDHQLR